jgi:hypothetical protein
MPFMLKLDILRNAYRVLNDLEESVDDLICGLVSVHDGDFVCAVTLLRAFQRRQEQPDRSAP